MIHKHGLCYQHAPGVSLQVDWELLAKAKEWYHRTCAYYYREVPWTVTPEADLSTRPEYITELPTPWGNLVGSAEQGFVQLGLEGYLQKEGRYCSITPCWRPEPKYDALHFPYFMKLELHTFRPSEPEKSLDRMIHSARIFFENVLECDVQEKETEQGVDLVVSVLPTPGVLARYEKRSQVKIELGSYGIRSYKGLTWVCGTGIAEPRLSTVRKWLSGRPRGLRR